MDVSESSEFRFEISLKKNRRRARIRDSTIEFTHKGIGIFLPFSYFSFTPGVTEKNGLMYSIRLDSDK